MFPAILLHGNHATIISIHCVQFLRIDFLFHFPSLSPYRYHIVTSLKLLTYNFLHRSLSSPFSSCRELSRFLSVFLVIDFSNFSLLLSSRTSRCFSDLISLPRIVTSSLNAHAFRLLEIFFRNLFIIISSEAQSISSCHSSSSFGKDQREDEFMFFFLIRFLRFVMEFVLEELGRFLLRPICAYTRSFVTPFSSFCQSLSSKAELVDCSKLANPSTLVERFKFAG